MDRGDRKYFAMDAATAAAVAAAAAAAPEPEPAGVIGQLFSPSASAGASSSAGGAGENQYRLYSVLVFCSAPFGGHYFTYIRPLTSDQWYKFNDERVTKVEEKEAVEGMFGGSEYQMPPWKTSSAYMLVYVRESAIPELSAEVTEDDLAAHMRDVKV